MRSLLLATMIASATAFGAMAQTSTTAPMSNSNADQKSPRPGANSFTEMQAKSRLESNGYSNVSALKKDDAGVWKGTAMQAGAKVDVTVDYRGTITRN